MMRRSLMIMVELCFLPNLFVEGFHNQYRQEPVPSSLQGLRSVFGTHRLHNGPSKDTLYEDLESLQSLRKVEALTNQEAALTQRQSSSFNVPGYPPVTEDYVTDNFYGKSYLYFTDVKVSWFKAYNFCRQHGLQMLTIENMDEFQWLLGFLGRAVDAPLFSRDESLAWVGANDLFNEGSFTYIYSGKPLPAFYNAPKGVPNKYCQKEHCVEVRRNQKDSTWTI